MVAEMLYDNIPLLGVQDSKIYAMEVKSMHFLRRRLSSTTDRPSVSVLSRYGFGQGISEPKGSWSEGILIRGLRIRTKPNLNPEQTHAFTLPIQNTRQNAPTMVSNTEREGRGGGGDARPYGGTSHLNSFAHLAYQRRLGRRVSLRRTAGWLWGPISLSGWLDGLERYCRWKCTW